MNSQERTEVAVLLATYNGAGHVARQISSLKENRVPFTLHWLDDHSSDDTRAIVRSSTEIGIKLREWHENERRGLPGSYFRLLELVDADIYLFCDQDDIWQPGRIDATVADLRNDISSPVLCFSDVLLFQDSRPDVFQRLFDFTPNGTIARLLEERRMFLFMPGCASAQTQGFTRALREMFLTHRDTAHTYASMHDWWMYDIAVAGGSVRMLIDAPKVLYRSHPNSYCARLVAFESNRLSKSWQINQLLRRVAARHARGLILASETFPQGENLERFLELARLVEKLDQRQSLSTIARLMRLGVVVGSSAKSMAITCYCSAALP